MTLTVMKRYMKLLGDPLNDQQMIAFIDKSSDLTVLDYSWAITYARRRNVSIPWNH
jgi:hypothetical protein